MMITSLLAAAGFTLKLPLVPDFPPPIVVIVTPVCALVMVTLPVHVPDEKPPVVTGLIVPVESVRLLVPI